MDNSTLQTAINKASDTLKALQFDASDKTFSFRKELGQKIVEMMAVQVKRADLMVAEDEG